MQARCTQWISDFLYPIFFEVLQNVIVKILQIINHERYRMFRKYFINNLIITFISNTIINNIY